MLVVLIIVAGVMAICGLASTILEVRDHRKHYEVLMKAFWVAAGIAGILVGLISTLG